MGNNQYDTVLCVGEQHKKIAINSIKSLAVFSQAKLIFVISSEKILKDLADELIEIKKLRLIDESTLIRGVDINWVAEHLNEKIGSVKRAGWYFQQFLKMGICLHPEISDHYLIWDSDSIQLEAIDFFYLDKVLVNPKDENHAPYFKTLESTIGLKKKVNFSFISEHFMIKKEFMKELISTLEARSKKGTCWSKHILNSIPDTEIGNSGFSEYETYGNFIATNYPDSFICRALVSRRDGRKNYGIQLTQSVLFQLLLTENSFMTFEIWDKPNRRKINRNRLLAFFNFWFSKLAGVNKEAIRNSKKIV